MLSTARTALPADTAVVAGAALRTFFNIADAWRLNAEQAMTLLGLDSRSTYFKWKKARKAPA